MPASSGLAACCAILLAAMLGTLLPAQSAPQASPEKESFVIEPGTVASGAKGVTLRFVSTTASGFATSSSKAPAVKFGSGVKLAGGGLQILNQNEAECLVDVEDSAFGTVEVRVELYGVNGSSVLKTMRGTLGVGGPLAIEGSQAKVSVEEVRLVRVNVEGPQQAGAVILSGGISGSVRVTAPTGTTFQAAPVATIDSGDINTPRLEEANTVFTFGIGNPQQQAVTVRISEIRYNTALYTASGGVLGNLACEITGAALSGQTTLVVNAFTARTTIEGSNDIPAEPSQPSNQSSESNNPTGGGIAMPPSVTRRDVDARPDRRRNDRPAPATAPGRGPVPGGAPAPAPRSAPGPATAPGAPAAPGQQPAPPAGGGAAPAPVSRGPSDSVVAPGGMTRQPMQTTTEAPEQTEQRITERSPTPRLEVAPGLYFCDREYQPISAVVLDRIVAGEAGGRVWVMLRLPQTRNPNRVDTLRVTLSVAGSPREITLTETGKDTGEFRCSPEGVLIVTEENPDSNQPEPEAVEPRARFTRR